MIELYGPTSIFLHGKSLVSDFLFSSAAVFDQYFFLTICADIKRNTSII